MTPQEKIDLHKNSCIDIIKSFVNKANDKETIKAMQEGLATYLTEAWGKGLLLGDTAKDSYFISIDGERLDPKQLHVSVHFSHEKPWEFYIVEYSQLQQG